MIVVIGKSGQLAQACAQLLQQSNVAYVCFGRQDINILDKQSIHETLDEVENIDAIINASAYTAVDQAESEQQQAIAMNATAVELLCAYAKSISAFFVHVSTDYVFSGQANQPYLPGAPYQPVNAYGHSKMLGEQAVQSLYPEGSCILRTSWVYSEFGNNFVKTMLRLFSQRDQLNVIMDQIGSPTSAHTLAAACVQVVNDRVTGIHHVCDLGVTSWFDFAATIHKQACELGFELKPVVIQPISTSEYPTPAARPHYSVLSTASLRSKATALTLPYWQDALRNVLQRIKQASDQ